MIGQRTVCVAWAVVVAAVSCSDPATSRNQEPSIPSAEPASWVRHYSDPDLRALASSMAGDPGVWAPMPGIGSAGTWLPDGSVTVWFVNDLRSLDSLGIGAAEPWVAGIARPAERLIALRVDGAQRNLSSLRGVYRHEAAHVLLHAATGGNIPRWFQEGYAQAVSGTWDWNDGWRLQFLLLRRGEAVIGDLDRRFRSGVDPEATYLLSYTAVATLFELAGEQGLAALFSSLRSGASFENSLRSVYGITGNDFETQWHRQVIDRYGWLYLFSRTGLIWLSVAALVLVLGVSRVRRDRERIRQMEREEREAELTTLDNVDDTWIDV